MIVTIPSSNDLDPALKFGRVHEPMVPYRLVDATNAVDTPKHTLYTHMLIYPLHVGLLRTSPLLFLSGMLGSERGWVCGSPLWTTLHHYISRKLLQERLRGSLQVRRALTALSSAWPADSV